MTSAARRLRDWILARPMSFTTETELQEAIAGRLDAEALIGDPIRGYAREFRLDDKNRIDFLVEVDNLMVGVEVKIGSSLIEVHRQLMRYAAFDEIDELLLVTTKAQHHRLSPHLGEARKPVVLCSLIGDAL